MARSAYRADIDGLRAVAIVAVVAFHAGLGGARGGYAGVDIFFVISGFLITELLLREIDATGGVSLRDFYARRIRRLAPAYGLVVITTVIAGLILLLPTGELESLGKWSIAASAFVANLIGWREQAGYFAPTADALPLLHLWTLAVEEQFYIFWPALLLLLARSTSRAKFAARAGITFVLCGLTSLGLSVVGEKLLSTEAVFFLTPFRIWEFCAGAVVAALPLGQRPRPKINHFIAGCGAALIVAFGLVTANVGQAHWLTKALPVLGAAMIIAAGRRTPQNFVSSLLGWAPLAYLGRLSYSWYLWHWPLLAFGRIVGGGDRNLARDSALVLAALGLSALTYHFLEDPVRRRRPGPFGSVRGTFVTGAAILAACAIGGAGLWLWGHRPTNDPAVTAVRSVETLTGHPRNTLGAPMASRSVLLWGDSHARHLEPALDQLGEQFGFGVMPRTLGACRFDGQDGAYTQRLRTECVSFSQEVTKSLPDLINDSGLRGVVLAARWTESDYQTQLAERVRILRSFGLRVLILEDGPLLERQPLLCLPRHRLDYCDVSRSSLEAARPIAIRTLRAVAASDPEIKVFSLLDALCDGDACPAQANGVIRYSDLNHLTKAGSLQIAPALEPYLRWAAGENPPQLAP